MLSELKFLPASRGTLQLLRRRLELVKRGKDILQMRRDQLAKELLSIMEYLRKRAEAEREFFEAARRVSLLRVVRGDYDFKSTASLVKPPKIVFLITSYQGVPVPQARIAERPDYSKVADPEYREAVEKLWGAVEKLIEVANSEVAVERIGEQLSYINRVVNSLEKNTIPALTDALRRIEERVIEEELEDFVRIRLLAGG